MYYNAHVHVLGHGALSYYIPTIQHLRRVSLMLISTLIAMQAAALLAMEHKVGEWNQKVHHSTSELCARMCVCYVVHSMYARHVSYRPR